MTSKLFLLVFVFLMVVGFAGAVISELPKPFIQNQCGQLLQNDVVEYETVSAVTLPDSTRIIIDKNMTKSGSSFNLTFCNTSQLDYYTVDGYDSNGEAWSYIFRVTKTGHEVAGDNLELFAYILFIIATVGLFVTLILTLVKLVTVSENIFGIIITWSFLVLMIIVNYLGKTYFISTFIETLSDKFITVTIWSNGVLPLISFIIAIFVRATQKKKNLTPQELTGRFTFNG